MRSVCKIDGCESSVQGGGMCGMHYQHWRRHGDPLAPKMLRNDDRGRFWSKVLVTPGCWLWNGTVSPNGYGAFSVKSRFVSAHRWSFSNAFGPIPDGLTIDHICHTPRCVNPDHLRVVTTKQNGENRRGPASNGTSGYLGVTLHRKTGRWQAQAHEYGKTYYGGLHDTPEAASEAAKSIRNRLFSCNDEDRAANR